VSTTAFVRDEAVPLTYDLSNTEAERITKSENSDLEIKNIWKLNNVPIYSLVMSAQVVFTRIFQKYVENMVLAQNILKIGAQSNTATNSSYSTYSPMTCLLTSGDRMNFLPLTELNPTDNL